MKLKLNKEIGLKALGLGAMVIGAVASMVSSYVSDKKTDMVIDDKITKKLGEAFTENEN